MDKLEKVVAKVHIELADIKFVKAIMYIIQVTKGDDIQMVYNKSKSGLKAAMYAP